MKRWIENLGDLTWCEAGEAFSKSPVVLLPLGAIEPHGPHLPLDSDVVIATEVARRTAMKLKTKGVPALILPPLSYATTDFAEGFPGRVSISPETTTSLVRDVACSVIGQGLKKFALANAHLEPAHLEALHRAVSEIEARTGVRPVFVDTTRAKWAKTLTEEYRRGECHAGAYETSLVMAVEPDSVRETLRKDLPPLHVDLAAKIRQGVKTFAAAGSEKAYFGDPASATPGDGHETYEILSEMIVAAVLEAWPAPAPRTNGTRAAEPAARPASGNASGGTHP
ncbi:MAG TPA: creatininase family protein [Planctomycetota bacterium]|jgi:creatinine amidohydrolase|nr:creatininase family protein [Planctomycetota bacterium]